MKRIAWDSKKRKLSTITIKTSKQDTPAAKERIVKKSRTSKAEELEDPLDVTAKIIVPPSGIEKLPPKAPVTDSTINPGTDKLTYKLIGDKRITVKSVGGEYSMDIGHPIKNKTTSTDLMISTPQNSLGFRFRRKTKCMSCGAG